MRDIRFRAWDNVEKKMLATVESWNKVWWDDTSPENEYDYHSKCLYIDNQGHVLEHTDEHGMCDMNYLLQGKPKYDLMQYTGLLDKNGKEIYEFCVLNGCYLVQYNAPRFILTSISTGDIIERWEGKDYEITREYVGDNTPIQEDPKRRTNQHLP